MCLPENVTSETVLLICICYPILLDDVLDGMMYLVNIDSILNLDDINIEEIYYFHFLESIVKHSIKLFDQSFKGHHIMCCHEDIIYFDYKKGFIYFVNPQE